MQSYTVRTELAIQAYEAGNEPDDIWASDYHESSMDLQHRDNWEVTIND